MPCGNPWTLSPRTNASTTSHSKQIAGVEIPSAGCSSASGSQASDPTAVAVTNRTRLIRARNPGTKRSANRSEIVARPIGSMLPSPAAGGSKADTAGNESPVSGNAATPPLRNPPSRECTPSSRVMMSPKQPREPTLETLRRARKVTTTLHPATGHHVNDELSRLAAILDQHECPRPPGTGRWSASHHVHAAGLRARHPYVPRRVRSPRRRLRIEVSGIRRPLWVPARRSACQLTCGALEPKRRRGSFCHDRKQVGRRHRRGGRRRRYSADDLADGGTGPCRYALAVGSDDRARRRPGSAR